MKIAIVGPAHPYKGGIAKHTTELAHRLENAGHQVTIISWRRQYPFFYPGQQFVPDDQPEVPLFANTRRVLSWRSAAGWAVWGRRLRRYDHVIFIWWVPKIQGPVYSVMLRALGRSTPTTLLCHNLLRHEAGAGDTALVRRVLKRVNNVVVHSKAQAELARSLGAARIIQTDLPPVLPPRGNTKAPFKLRHRLLFFGIVRPYKGLDVLLKALAAMPDVKLTVAGEIWGKTDYPQLAKQLGVAQRVEFLNRYAPDAELEKLFGTADALVLPYRGGTATFNATYAHYFHIPVIATTAPALGGQVKNGVNGLLCEPDNVEALAAAIRHFYEPGVAKHLQAGIVPPNADKDWQAYLAAVVV